MMKSKIFKITYTNKKTIPLWYSIPLSVFSICVVVYGMLTIINIEYLYSTLLKMYSRMSAGSPYT